MYARILVPIDGSETAERGLREAIALAQETKAHLLLLHVVDDYPLLMELAATSNFNEMRSSMIAFGERVLEKARLQADELGVSAECALREVSSSRAAEAIVEEAARRNCQLIVMGTHGRHGFNRLAMGSDAELVVREAPVPVLLVRHQGAKD